MTASTDEITLALDELESRLDRLRSLYEQYFTGIEKAPPQVQHKDVERRIQLLRKLQIRNTAQRFRFQTLIQKYTTYLQYWQRILRRIEEGTHKRDLARAQRYGVRPKPRRSSDGVYELDPSDVDDYADVDAELEPPTNELPALRPAAQGAPPTTSTPPAVAQPSLRAQPTRQVEVLPLDVVESTARVAAAPLVARDAERSTVSASAPQPNSASHRSNGASLAPPPAQPAKKPGLSVFGVAQKPQATQPAATRAQPAAARPSAVTAAPEPARPTSSDAALRQLFERYREARRRNGEAEVEFDTVARQVRDTLPRLREKYPGQSVELDVAIKDGKTVLRPIVKPKK
jgi:hypothetical protein